MDDAVFFDTILPSQGLRCIAIRKEDGRVSHLWGPDNAWLANTTKQISASQNVNVYHGCASYLPQAQDRARDPATRKLVLGGRKQTNVMLLRSFWVDLDVGRSEEGKPAKYATAVDAGRAILGFCKKLGLPAPMVVSSGWGLHVYWPIDRDMPVDEWKPVAQALKRALTAEGVLFDPSRTADEASILRPPGTYNRKAKPKLVDVVREAAQGPLDAVRNPLGQWIVATPADPFAHMGPAPAGLSKANAGLTQGAGPEPSSALMIADQCGIIGMMRDTRGKLDQPTWYNSLGVLTHTIEAPGICHNWSMGDPRYTPTEVTEKLAQLSSHGPTTCVKLGENHPDVCKACPHFEKITSPIQLGRPRIEKATVETVERVVSKRGFLTEKTIKIDLPHGYGETVQDGVRVLTHQRKVTAKDGTVAIETDVICSTHLYGVTRLWGEDGAEFEFERISQEGLVRFTIKGSTIGSGGRELSAELGRNAVVARNGKVPQLHSYMSHWMEQLNRTAELVSAYRSFGWTDDLGFVLGDTILRPDGSETRAVLTGTAKQKMAAVARKGNRDTWVQLIDRAYNVPGQEAFQFQIGCGFAAPLLRLMNEVSGVTVYSHSAGSGVGKTTVQKVGLSIWGDWEPMMLAQGHVTINSMWNLMGAYQSLPVVYDELTNAPNNDVSELVFSVSSGRAKERLSASGELRTNNSNWSTILLASGNTLLSEKLAQHRANTEAEISRLFEFTLDPPPHLTIAEANAIFPQFREHYGHAGYEFARYVVTHREYVAKMMVDMREKVHTSFGMTQVERYWTALFTAVLTAVAICRHLGLVSFEIKALRKWMRDRLVENRGGRAAAVVSHEELIGKMISDLWAGVLVTTGVGNLKTGSPALIEKEVFGQFVGRAIVPTGTDKAQLEINRAAIHDWCGAHGTSHVELLAAAQRKGWCYPKVDRCGIGRGTKKYNTTAYVWCWKFDPDAMNDVMPSTQLSLLQGGKP